MSESDRSNQTPSRHDWIDRLASAAVIAASLVVATVAVLSRGGENPPPTPPAAVPLPDVPIRLDESATLGRADAPVVLVMFSDFQCPYCATFAEETLPTLQRDYGEPGQVRFVFRHLPLERLHSEAMGAAVGAECARRQGKFWEMHDGLFAIRATALGEGAIAERALDIGLDMPAFRACVADSGAAAVRLDLEDAERFGVTGTPGFIIGTVAADGSVVPRRRLSGALPVEEFRAALDEVLAERPGHR
jgi:protein-disulfide isomerase